jgi:ABC-type multidrug transport system fused ATPase/permease subunit
MPEEERYLNTSFIRDMWFILDSQRYKFLFWYIIRLLSSAIGLLPMYAVGKIIDFLTHYTEGSLHTLYFWLGVIFVSSSVAVFARLGSKYKIGNVSREVQRNVRLRALATLLQHSLSWHEEEGSGQKVQRINTGTQGLQTFMRFLSQDSTDIVVGIIGVALFFL